MTITRPSDPRCLRIAILGSTYPRNEQDHEVPWLRESVKRLAARGHKVTVIAPAYRGLNSHQIDGVPVHRFRYAPAQWEILTHGEGAPNKLKKNPVLKLLTLSYLASGAYAVWQICRKKMDPGSARALAFPARVNGVPTGLDAGEQDSLFLS